MPISQPTFQPGNITLTGAASSAITNLSMPTSGTEYSLVLQNDLKQLIIKARGSSKLQLAFTATESGTKYITIPKGTVLTLSELSFSSTTVYLQASANNEIAEVLELF